MKLIKKLKRTMQGFSTVLRLQGLPFKQYGYYIPYPYAQGLETPQDLYPLPWLAKLLESNLAAFEGVIKKACLYNSIFESFEKGSKTDPLAPRFNQDWFCGIDGAAAYSIVRDIKPNLIVEVGSGFSTRFLARAVKDEGLQTEICGINPKVLHAADKLCAKFYNTTFDKVPRDIFSRIKANDILFIDASHLFMAGTDLEILMLDIIPNLPKGVYIHFHDIFLPSDYPDEQDWKWWAFNEQQTLAIMLASGGYKPVFASAYIQKYHPELTKNIFAPCHPRGLESSFWVIKQK